MFFIPEFLQNIISDSIQFSHVVYSEQMWMFKPISFEFKDEDIFRLRHHLKGRSGIAYGFTVFFVLLLLCATGISGNNSQLFVSDLLRFIRMLTHQRYTFRASPHVTSMKRWFFIAFGLWMINLTILSQTSADLMHVDRTAYPKTLFDFFSSGLLPCWGTSMF